MASNPPGKCCTVGVKHEGESSGELKKIGDVEVYLAYPSNKSTHNAILLLTDVIGHRFINAQLIADQFAANGYFVVMPDIFRGDPIPLNRPQGFDLMKWLQGPPGHGPNMVDPVVDLCLKEMRGSMGCKRIGGVGYCFGAKYVVRHMKPGQIDVGYMAHPSFVEETELEAITGPVSISAAEHDDIFPVEKRHKSEEIFKKTGQAWQINLFSDVHHGFSVRGDLSVKQNVFAKEQAFLQAVHCLPQPEIRDGKGPISSLFVGSIPKPTPTGTQALVHIKAFGLNRMDLLQREGHYPVPKGASEILGVEFSGIIEEFGDDVEKGFKIGDEVFGLAYGGAYAEYIVVSTHMLMHKPTELSWEEAAGIPETWLTALQALHLIGQHKPGESILWHAGASSVSIAGIQLSQAASASPIYVTAGSASKIDFCTATLGATKGWNYHSVDWAQELLRETNGTGVDVIIDYIGAGYFAQNLAAAAVDGRIVNLAFLGGIKLPEGVDISPFLRKRLRYEGSSLRSRDEAYQRRLRDMLVEKAMPKFRDGSFKVYVEKVFQMEEIQAAHRLMESNATKGKLICLVVVKVLQNEADDVTSVLNESEERRKLELEAILRNCMKTLNQLSSYLDEYNNLENSHNDRSWSMLCFTSVQSHAIRSRLMTHTSAIVFFLSNLCRGSFGLTEDKLHDVTMKVQPRIYKQESSIEASPWKLLMSELVEDTKLSDIEAHKKEIKYYIRTLVQNQDIKKDPDTKGDLDNKDNLDIKENPDTKKGVPVSTDHTPATSSIGMSTGSKRSAKTRRDLRATVESVDESDSEVNTSKRPAKADSNDSRKPFLDISEPTAEATAVPTIVPTTVPTAEATSKRTTRVIDSIFGLFPPLGYKNSANDLCVGIDLGPDYCSIATYDYSLCDAILLQNEHCNRNTPVYIAFTPNDILIGENAKSQAARNAENTIFGFSRLLGKRYDDGFVRGFCKNLPFQVINDGGKPAFWIPTRNKAYSPETLVAFLLSKLLRLAELHFKSSIGCTYIAVHPSCTIEERHSIYRAGQAALESHISRFFIYVVTASTAVAFKYAHDSATRLQHEKSDEALRETVLIVNVGAYGFDIVAATIKKGISRRGRIELVGGESSSLQGKSIDQEIVESKHQELRRMHSKITKFSPRAKVRVKKAVEEARKQLISASNVPMELESLQDSFDFVSALDRTDIEAQVKDILLPRLSSACKRFGACRRIEKVIFTGDLAKMPLIRNTVRSEIKALDNQSSEADATVYLMRSVDDIAIGAALEAANQKSDISPTQFSQCDFAPDILGLEVGTDIEKPSKIIDIGTHARIPSVKKMMFRTLSEDQGGIYFHVFTKNVDGQSSTFHDLVRLAVSCPPNELMTRFFDVEIQVSFLENHELEFCLSTIAIGRNRRYKLLDLVCEQDGNLQVRKGGCVPITESIEKYWRLAEV
ncbi:MAG: hypothetical protein M1834_007263 [Cirrosporium novae-zelandiae]|nr:MAG: hypothetical protein M1834_007263 [Cirrosporium novae-zelandiae]